MNFQYRRGQRPILRHNWTGTIIDGGCGRDGSLIKEAWPTSQYLGKREKKLFPGEDAVLKGNWIWR
jgi:hypothetical protein